MIKIINENIINSKEKYIAHSCNAVSNTSAGLAKTIFDTFPYSNIYKSRSYPYTPTNDELPGNIFIKGNDADERFIINLISQFYPGKPKYPNSPTDGYLIREKYFKKCLDKIANISNLDSIAFPYLISCGLAGGDWNNYSKILEDFAAKIEKEQNAYVIIYKI